MSRRCLAIALAALAGAQLAACAWLGGRPWLEPDHAWFSFYPGPMRPLEEVAVLCPGDRGANVVSIRRQNDPHPTPARYEKWHFPECIEALPGSYELEVNYFSRSTHFEPAATVTETMESPVPLRAVWIAEAGGVYLLKPALGSMAPAPGIKPRAPRESATTRGRWYVRAWTVEIERLASLDEVAGPMRERREAWRRYADR